MKKLLVLFLSLFGAKNAFAQYGSPPPPPPPCNTPQCASGTYCYSNTNLCTVCPSGYMYKANPNVGVSSVNLWGCTICPAGTFSANAGSGGCTSCSIGTFSASAGSSGCTSCSSGSTYADATGRSNCLICSTCSSGTYLSSGCTTSANTICTACPTIANCGVISTCTTAANSQCTICSSGYYLINTNSCQSCSTCTSGTYYETGACTSSTNRQCSTCINTCPVGQMLAGNCAGTSNTYCVVCPTGYYKTTADNSPCIACIKTCGAGYALNPLCSASTNSICVSCPSGSYKTTTDNSLICLTCTSVCSAGYQLNQACTATVNPRCIICPTGFYKASADGSACLACTSVCNAGYQLNQPCSPTANPLCIPCQIGFYKAVADGSPCLTCTSICNAGYELNQACSATVNPLCIPCQTGFYKTVADGSECLACTADCGAGAYLTSRCTATNNPTCAFCPVNTANPNQFSIFQSSCITCPNGAISAIGSATCVQCPLGTATLGNVNCTSCAPGTYADNTGSIQCKLCPSGTANALFKATTITACINCPAGYFSATGSAQCTACPIGTYDKELDNVCWECPSGTYNNLIGQTICTKCPAGTANALNNSVNSAVCINCLPGSFSSENGSAVCALCPAGTSSALFGASNCILNLPGTFTAINGSTNVAKCPPGSYSDTSGASACMACRGGTMNPLYGAANATNCTLCSAGTFMPFSGSAICINAIPGFYQDQPGQLNATACPIGTANNKTGANSREACILCISGKWQNQTGASSCQDCPVGYYQPSSGQNSCLACPAGTYNSFMGISAYTQACIACPVGSYSPTIAASAKTTCLFAPLGAYTNTTGSANYTLCSAGTYQPQVNQTSCLACNAGTYNSAIGSIHNESCIPSLPGFYVPFTGFHTFLPCSPGTWTNIKGKINCEACLPGTYAPSIASTSCLPCPAGTFALGTGFAECQPIGTPTINYTSTLINAFSIELTINTNFTALVPFQYTCSGVCQIYVNQHLIETVNNIPTQTTTILLNLILGLDTVSVIYNGTFQGIFLNNDKEEYWFCSNLSTYCSILPENNVILSAQLIVEKSSSIENIYANPNITTARMLIFDTAMASAASTFKAQTYTFLLTNLEAAVIYNIHLIFQIIKQPADNFSPLKLDDITTLAAVPTGSVQNVVQYFLGINIVERANIEQTNLQIHWDAPEIVLQHGLILGYMVLYQQQERTFISYGPTVNVTIVPAADFSVFTNETTIILTQLIPDTKYNITIFPLTKAVGLGPGNSIQIQTQVSAPPKPPILVLLARKATNITVSWPSLTNETGIITKAWIIAEPYSNETSAQVIHINLNFPTLPPPNMAGIHGFFAPYNVSHPCTDHLNGYNFKSRLTGQICGGMCEQKCEYGTPMLDPTTMLPTNNQNLTNDNYIMEFINNEGNISSRLVPYLTMKKRFVLNVSEGGLNLSGKVVLGDGKINPVSLLNNTFLDPTLSYRIRLIVFTSETLYAISDPLEIPPFQEEFSPNIFAAAAYIGFSIALCILIILIIFIALTKNRLKKSADMKILKSGEIGSSSTDEEEEDYYYEAEMNKPPVYSEALPDVPPQAYAVIAAATANNTYFDVFDHYHPIKNNAIIPTSSIYFDTSSENAPPKLPEKQKNKKNKEKKKNNNEYFEVSDYIRNDYIQNDNIYLDENEEEIFAVPSHLKEVESISNPTYHITKTNETVYFSNYLSKQLNNNKY